MTPNGLSAARSTRTFTSILFAQALRCAGLKGANAGPPLFTALRSHMPEWSAPFAHVHALEFHLKSICCPLGYMESTFG
ncbi:MAG: hypothetical protein ACKODM_11280 [Cytophagales bacterium]